MRYQIIHLPQMLPIHLQNPQHRQVREIIRKYAPQLSRTTDCELITVAFTYFFEKNDDLYAKNVYVSFVTATNIS